MSAGRYKAAWAGSLVGNVGWIYLSFASGLTGMALYSICMIGVAIRGLWKYISNDTKHRVFGYIGYHNVFYDYRTIENDRGGLIIKSGRTCSKCNWSTFDD